MDATPTLAIVGLGANLGARAAALHAAVELLEAAPGVRVVARSKVYDTEPMGPPQPRYLNAAVRLETTLEPEALLELLLATERRLERDRTTSPRWGARTIDLDLLWYGGRTVRTERLEVPHPGLLERSFALAPLLDVAPELEEELGPRLAALGGAPAGRRFAGLPAVRSDARLRHAHAADDADGWAMALAAIARDVAEPGPVVTSEPFRVVSLPDLVEVVERAFHRGLGVHLVTLSSLEPGVIRGSLHGALTTPRAPRIRASRVAGGYVWIEAAGA
ncbi:MAG: 2-amino-4-hydroxy-6-hydroxymethyldihydropteridine diphosphokinase [Polyangiales bacterium]